MLARPECAELVSWERFCAFPPSMGLACRRHPQCCVMKEVGGRFWSQSSVTAQGCERAVAQECRAVAGVQCRRLQITPLRGHRRATCLLCPAPLLQGYVYIHLVGQAKCMTTAKGG